MYIDPALAGAIGVVYTTAIGAVAWLFGKVWKDRGRLQVKMFEMLELQLNDNERRRDLWDKQAEVITKSTESVKDLGREIVALKAEVQRIQRAT